MATSFRFVERPSSDRLPGWSREGEQISLADCDQPSTRAGEKRHKWGLAGAVQQFGVLAMQISGRALCSKTYRRQGLSAPGPLFEGYDAVAHLRLILTPHGGGDDKVPRDEESACQLNRTTSVGARHNATVTDHSETGSYLSDGVDGSTRTASHCAMLVL